MGARESKQLALKYTGERRVSVFEGVAEAIRRKECRMEDERKLKQERIQEEERRRERSKDKMNEIKQRKEKITEQKNSQAQKLLQLNAERLEKKIEAKKHFNGPDDPENESDRMMALRSIRALDTETGDPNFDRVSLLLKDVFNVFIAAVSLIDEHRQWFKSIAGFDAPELCRNDSFCSFTIKRNDPLIIYDLREDDRTKNSPGVLHFGLKFYAGAQLTSPDGLNIGTLCIMDVNPRTEETFGKDQLAILTTMAKTVSRELELHKLLIESRNKNLLQSSLTQFGYDSLLISDTRDCMEMALVNIIENMNVNRVTAHLLSSNLTILHETHAGNTTLDDSDPDIIKMAIDHVNVDDPVWMVDDLYNMKENSDLFEEHKIRNAFYSVIYNSEGQPSMLLSGYRTCEHATWGRDETTFVTDITKSLGKILERNQWQEEILTEKKKSDDILLNILPRPIVNRMTKLNQTNIADRVDSVSVLFADICGFTVLSQTMSADNLVSFLNLIFCSFDKLAMLHGCEKIKTIGDCYLAEAGLLSHEDDHSSTIIDFALDILEEIQSEYIQSRHSLCMRIGINTGPVVAGVIGFSKYTYDIWGDSVNTAQRMESHGVAGKIQISESTYNHLGNKANNYIISDRGIINVKGKGKMRTYLINSKKDGKVRNRSLSSVNLMESSPTPLEEIIGDRNRTPRI
ncbi:adenylate cyclase [Acrasis kona]|uniref:Adenylate cyclase n=1 Tax=Acrasis kona TaxID=1008807 RepID=A0AAW2YWN7_9EUKA